MKIFVTQNTRINGEHLAANKVHEVDEQHGNFLVRLGRAKHHKEEVKIEDIITKHEDIQENNNKEVELSKKVVRRTKKNKEE